MARYLIPLSLLVATLLSGCGGTVSAPAGVESPGENPSALGACAGAQTLSPCPPALQGKHRDARASGPHAS